MSELKHSTKEAIPGGAGKSGALSSAQRTGRSGKHLPRCSESRSGKPAGDHHAAARGDRSIRQRLRRRATRRRRSCLGESKANTNALITPASLRSGAPKRSLRKTRRIAAFRLTIFSRSDGLVRESRRNSAARKRRCASALEHLRANHRRNNLVAARRRADRISTRVTVACAATLSGLSHS